MISLYQRANHVKDGETIAFDLFLSAIKDGKWEDLAHKIRQIPGKAERDIAKKLLPNVTISGTFSERTDSNLLSHSGYIAIDIDDVDPEETKSLVCVDAYVYAAFTSVSGRGLCLIIRIDPNKHRQAFAGISEYLFNTYQVIVDPTGVNPSRARFVSFDPHLYHNESAHKFNLYLPEPKQGRIQEIIFVKTDFDTIMRDIGLNRANLAKSYQDWLFIGFSLADKFGEYGRPYFQLVSDISAIYRPSSQAAKQDLIDRQYTACLKGRRKGITIATFYWYAKQCGVQTMSERTKLIARSAMMSKQQARTKEDTVRLLEEVEMISSLDSADIVDQVFATNAEIAIEKNEIDDLKMWLKQNYSLRLNDVSRFIENNGTALETREFNSVFISAKGIHKKLTPDLFERVINSDFTPTYNPIRDFFESNKERRPQGCIDALFACIETDTGMSSGEMFANYAGYFGTKWLVSIVSSAYGVHSPLMLVLSGAKIGTGKTDFFRRLIPSPLKSYYAESKLDRGKDDEILMTQNLIIMDDEMGGKSKQEAKLMKELTSKQTFSLREPYGRHNVKLNRLAVLCGTSNNSDLITDPYENRRIIPINCLSIDQQAYNRIDKVDLFMEAYWLFQNGFEWRVLRDDIATLTRHTSEFQEPSAEGELLMQYFKLPKDQEENSAKGQEFMTTTMIKSHIEQRSMQKISIGKLGQQLKRLGFEKTQKRIGTVPAWGYIVSHRG